MRYVLKVAHCEGKTKVTMADLDKRDIYMLVAMHAIASNPELAGLKSKSIAEKAMEISVEMVKEQKLADQ
jgi:hypothetical protein